MIVTKKNNIIIFFLIFLSCSAQKKSLTNDCIKINIETENKYDGDNKIILKNFIDFNSKTNTILDILRISTVVGYDHAEEIKRVYIENKKVFIVQNNRKRKANISCKQFQDGFIKCNGIISLINCNNKSSQKNFYRFFVKKNNQIVMTFTSNELIENINPDLIKNESLYIDFFEQIK